MRRLGAGRRWGDAGQSDQVRAPAGRPTTKVAFKHHARSAKDAQITGKDLQTTPNPAQMFVRLRGKQAAAARLVGGQPRSLGRVTNTVPRRPPTSPPPHSRKALRARQEGPREQSKLSCRAWARARSPMDGRHGEQGPAHLEGQHLCTSHRVCKDTLLAARERQVTSSDV